MVPILCKDSRANGRFVSVNFYLVKVYFHEINYVKKYVLLLFIFNK